MKTEKEIKDMIDHFEGHANDTEETIEQQNRYKAMVKALHMVVDINMKSEQEVKDMISKFETNTDDKAMVNALQMVLE
jgi:low affinity Fe/Cu permease